MPNVHIHLLPSFLDGQSLQGSTAIVIDVLRASTTMVHSLAHGARAVVPCLTVDEAIAKSSQFPFSTRLLGGERRGELIPGFDLDNSPLKYTPEVVGKKTVLFTTTNGTKALLSCQEATHVAVGAFVNLTAVVTAIQNWGIDVHFVCAGTDNHWAEEDTLFAGAAASELVKSADSKWNVDDLQTQMVIDYFNARNTSPESLRQAFLSGHGAKNLQRLGLQPDIERAMQKDLFEIVPVWNSESNEITILGESKFQG
ncbi:2-phosphosulfolactate phosphatase [Planctomicrobium sp. SH668]|uniref:2-phosphosulfolactate phosphatase n=1 Tax=Planctomicrobium sp. SH668 TaxID=3448126 RepID=UPI003F5BB348